MKMRNNAATVLSIEGSARPMQAKALSAEGLPAWKILRIAAAIERYSEHPLASAPARSAYISERTAAWHPLPVVTWDG
jgi:cation transport ATPase